MAKAGAGGGLGDGDGGHGRWEEGSLLDGQPFFLRESRDAVVSLRFWLDLVQPAAMALSGDGDCHPDLTHPSLILGAADDFISSSLSSLSSSLVLLRGPPPPWAISLRARDIFCPSPCAAALSPPPLSSASGPLLDAAQRQTQCTGLPRGAPTPFPPPQSFFSSSFSLTTGSPDALPVLISMTSPDSDVPPDIDSSRLRGDLPLRPVAGLRGSLSTTDAARGSARAREAQYPCPDSSLEHGAAVEAPLAASSRPCLVEGQPAVDSGPPEASDKAGEAEGRSRRFRAVAKEVRRTCWMSLTYSWLNVLLVFVPLGIIVAKVGNVPGGVVFATNCIAVVPLAGMLSFATESVARNMGDSLGALLNVTFGNAVEMIIL